MPFFLSARHLCQCRKTIYMYSGKFADSGIKEDQAHLANSIQGRKQIKKKKCSRFQYFMILRRHSDITIIIKRFFSFLLKTRIIYFIEPYEVLK